jgi:ferric iron reductase protein FhuF
MTTLSNDQIRQLNNYSVYLEPVGTPLFHAQNVNSALSMIKLISGAPTDPIAASFFMRRVGMFISMQFYMMTMYDEIWDGPLEDLTFFATTEYGNKTISTYIQEEHFRETSENRAEDVQLIWEQQCYPIIQQLRAKCSVSPLTLWENVFGYLLWHYYVFFGNEAIVDQAKHDWALMQNEAIWTTFTSRSFLSNYLKGKSPAQLINNPVRTTCCFSKDIPGLQKCGFCPLYS